MSAAATVHEHSNTGMPNRKLAMWLFLASDCMFFGSLIGTYLVYQGKSLVGPYPTDVFDIPLTSFSSFVLLLSSYAMVIQLDGINNGDLKKFRIWNAITCICGLIFLGCQYYEFNHFVHAGLTLSTNLFGSTFYVLTGTHGTHVAIGVLWLISLFVLSFFGRVTKETALDVEIAGLYWHFVDIVWIVIFTVVYLVEYV